MPRRSPLTSVTPALSIATSVPVPMAMPTSACASAGASLMPSPAIATMRPSCWSFLTTSRLPLGQHLRLHLVDARASRHRLGRRPAVAGQHHDPQALFVQLADRLGGRRLDRIGDAEQPGEPAVDRDEHHRLPFLAQLFRRSSKGADGDARAPPAAPGCRARRARPSDPCRGRPCRCVDSKSSAPCRVASSALLRAADDRRGQRVLAARSRLAASRSSSSSTRCRRRCRPLTSFGLPSVSVPVLSTTSVSTFSQQLERLGVLDQHAGAAPRAGADHDRHRRRQTRARRGRR